MNATRLKLLPLAAALSLGLGVAGNVQAEAYAFSYNNIFGLFVDDDPASPTAVNITNASSTAATLTGFGGCANAAAGTALAPANALPCNINVPGGAKADNDMTPYGNVPGSTFARSDAQIVSSGAISLGQAWNVAESRVPGDLTLGTGAGNNSSETGLTYVLTLPTTATITIGFNADPYMESFLSPGAGGASFARAILSASATLSKAGAPVFVWAPNGAAGGVLGGTELFDPFSLNLTVARTPLDPGGAVYDPSGGGAADVGDLTPGTWGFFLATTDPLPAGTYVLNLAMTERTETLQVPEPATLGLVGLALLGLGAAGRRRRGG